MPKTGEHLGLEQTWWFDGRRAVRDSTLYRTLFLTALILFAMTFVVNTIAEMVRLRFRRRAFQL